MSCWKISKVPYARERDLEFGQNRPPLREHISLESVRHFPVKVSGKEPPGMERETSNKHASLSESGSFL